MIKNIINVKIKDIMKDGIKGIINNIIEDIIMEIFMNIIKDISKDIRKFFLVAGIKLLYRTTELNKKDVFYMIINIHNLILFTNFLQNKYLGKYFCKLGSQDLPLFAPLRTSSRTSLRISKRTLSMTSLRPSLWTYSWKSRSTS